MWFHSFLASWKSERSRSRRPQPRPAGRGTRLVLEHLEDRCLPSSYTATNASQLAADITAANAAGGANTITLTAPISSPIALTGGLSIAANDNLTIVGNSDTIEGPVPNGEHGIDVAAGASLTLENLTLKGFLTHEALQGAAIYNQGALTLSAVTVMSNGESGLRPGGTPALGGAIWSSGWLTLENGTLFEDNEAYGSSVEYGPGSNAYGGALYIAGGTANISDTSFKENVAFGGGGLPDGTAFGGAIYVAAGQVVMSNTSINGNSLNSVGDNLADVTYGGGLYVAGGTVTLANCTVDSNRTATDATGYGGGLYVAAGIVTLTNCTVQSNTATAYGGGIYIASAGTVSIDPFTVANTVNNRDSSGTNGSTANIDGPYVLTPAAGQPPIVVNAASANPSPVTGTTAKLSVLGDDDAGFSSLTYTWAVTSAPAGAATPTFSSDGSNASQDTTATFYIAGTYTFQVTITDPSGLTAVSSVTVTVAQTVSSISITPGNVTVADGAKQQFTAVTLDQFGQAMASQPTFTWKVSSSSGGTIGSTGLYTAPKKGTGTFEVEVSADGLNAEANVTLVA